MKIFLSLVILSIVVYVESRYEIPDIKVEATKTGLRVSLPDDPGVQIFEFHANINKEIGEKEIGDIFDRVSSPVNGQWTFHDKHVELKPGDTLHYWVTVYNNLEKNLETFDKHGYKFDVKELVD